VAKSSDLAKKPSGVVCAGDYVELFQRQSQVYLHRAPDGQAFCYNTTGDPVIDTADVPATDLRADLLWQLNMPTMQWCGKAVQHSAREPTSFSLRDGISGGFLYQDSGQSGQPLSFQDTDNDPGCHWILVPFEEDTEDFATETTQFYIQNAHSGFRLSKGSALDGSSDDDTYEGIKYGLVASDAATVHEDDLFVFRTLPIAWVKEFFQTMQMVDVLKRFTEDVKEAVVAMKKNMRGAGQGTDPRVEKIRQDYLLPDSDIKSDSQWTGPVPRVLEYLLVNLSFSSNKNLLQRDGIVNAALQLQLTEIGIVRFLLEEMLPSMFELVSAEEINACTKGPYFLRVVQYAYRVVCMMAKENSVNSRQIFNKLEDIAQYMSGDMDFKVANTITMVFSGDEKLMRDCEDEFIERMWKLGATVKAKRFVAFIDTILFVNGGPLKFNQDRVSRIIRENDVPGLFEIDFKYEASITPKGKAMVDNAAVRFHTGLIDMAASLCAGRHRDSIDYFLTSTPLQYSLVLERIVDASIPAEVRICYAKLMRNLFVDREPFELNTPVQPSRIMPPLTGTAKEIEDRLGVPPPVQVDPYASLQNVERPTPGFADLKDTIFTIFGRQVEIKAKDVRHNQFLVEMIGLAHQLLLFGLYDGAVVAGKHHDGVLTLGDEAIELGSKLLLMIDGRTDNMDDLDGDETDVPKRFRTDLLETNVLMTLKKSILALIIDLFGLRSSTKIRILLKTVVDNLAKGGNNGTAMTFEDESDYMENPLGPPKGGVAVSTGPKSPQAPVITPEELELAKSAMDEAEKVRVYKGEEEMQTLEGSLLDMLRYSQDLDLCFGAFNTLVFFVSQNFVFAQTLDKVNILGTTDLARNYITAGQQMSEFRRLRKWLHQEEETQQCIAVAKKLIQWCETKDGQDLLRSLSLEEYLTRVLKMRMQTESFPELLKLCMRLVAAFCLGNLANQEIFANHMESILLKLLWEPQYYGEGAAMLTAVVDENEHLSVVYSPKLVSAVGELSLSAEHGRQIGLLIMLEQLLVVEDHPVTASQVSICKGAMVSRKLIETEGKILDDEWGEGSRMDRLEAIQVATADGESADKERAILGVEYYCKCLEILGICARGKMPTTELLCASMLPFEECMTRMHELYNDDVLRACADSHDDLDPTVRSKSALFAFFREVFVDTNSEHILRSLRRPSNGLWVVEETVDASTNHAIVKHLIDEMKRLAQKTTPLPRGDLRDYLYEQACMFFIQYARVVAPSATAKEETKIIQGFFAEVGSIVDHAGDDPTSTPRERVILSQLSTCCAEYVQGTAPQAGDAEKELAAATRTAKVEAPLTGNALAWDSFVTAAVSTVPVMTVRGTDRRVGIGLLKLGMLVWGDVVDKDDEGNDVVTGKYAGFLVGPLREKMKALRTQSTATDDIAKLMVVLDTIRAIPYTATAYDDEKTNEAFQKFVEVTPLDCAISPDLAAVQKEMVTQGWAILALEVLNAEELSELHLTCLRLLMALTGGGNVDVQDTLFEQITDLSVNPVELLSGACRRLLRLSVQDLKTQRKAVEAMKQGLVLPAGADQAKGFAYETLTFMSNCCKGNHRNMQDYLRDPINHQERFDVIGDAVNYLNQLERDLKAAVAEEAAHIYHHRSSMGTGGEDWYDHDEAADKKTKGHDLSPALERANAAFDLLRFMASGPNLENQRAVAMSEILPCMNRILSYTEYDVIEDVNDSGANNETAKGQLGAQVSYILLALVEGVPDAIVVRRMISALDWNHFARHLKVLKLLIEEGVLEAGEDDDQNEKKKKKKKKKEGGLKVPTTTSDPKKDRCAKWLEKEAFRFYSIVEKLRIAGTALMENADPADNEALSAMQPVFSDVETQNFYSDRVGQVEVVRDGGLERLFFMLPYNVRKRKDARMIDSNIKSVMDSCPREDAGEKITDFLEGAYEIVGNVDSQDAAEALSGARLPAFFAWCARVSPTMYLSAFISAICCAALDKSPGISRNSLDPATFGRWSDADVAGFEYFLFFASIHVVITIMRTYAFFRIRFPVLKDMYTRKAKLDYLGNDQGLVESSFVDRSVVIYGLPYEVKGRVVDQTFVSALLRPYGFVNVARVVPVAPEEGVLGGNPKKGGWTSANNSFALVSFARDQAVTNVMAAQEKGGGTLTEKGINLTAVDVTDEYVENSGTLSKLVDDAELEMLFKQADPLYVVAANAQRIANNLYIGKYLPIVTAYVFRFDSELRESFLDIGFSLLGFFYSPLAFSFHLFKITKTDGAAIVVTSMTHNVKRLSVTIMLCLLFSWVFAILGLLYFQEFHMDGTPGHSPNAVNNAGGPCPNLLTCFMSYSYAGLMQAGVGDFLTGNAFPVVGADVVGFEFVKTLWEIVRTQLTSAQLAPVAAALA
jgi:hypothetical protein